MWIGKILGVRFVDISVAFAASLTSSTIQLVSEQNSSRGLITSHKW